MHPLSCFAPLGLDDERLLAVGVADSTSSHSSLITVAIRTHSHVAGYGKRHDESIASGVRSAV